MENKKKNILTAATASKKLRRIALELVERNNDATAMVLVGIKENGCVIAKKISDYLKEVYSGKITLIALVIDKKKPAEILLDPVIDFNNQTIILVDDVANSGKTMLYALKPLLEVYPKKIQTVALVERTHKSFPIALDYVGVSISTDFDENIVVEVNNGKVCGAWIEEK